MRPFRERRQSPPLRLGSHIGPASTASVTAAIDAGQRLGVLILLDVPATTHRWVTVMERAGVDGFTITIDLGIGNTTALDAARELRAWT